MSDDLLQPPEEVLKAANEDRLVFFFGAGVSKLMGFPLWRDLSIQLLDSATQKGLISYSSRQQIINNTTDNKLLASLVLSIYGDRKRWAEELRKILEKNPQDSAGSRIVKMITEGLFPIVTTNYDHNVEKMCPSYDSYLSCDCDGWVPSKPSVVHIHGSITEPDNMVVTTIDYFNHYRVNNEKTKTLLDKIFGTGNVVVFIGYSLSEIELLEFILKKDSSGKFYFLNPYFSYNKPYMDFLTEYYKTINVIHMPYCIDHKGYDALEGIVRSWMDCINTKTWRTLHQIKKIDDELSKGINDDSVDNIIKIIVSKVAEVYFYKILLSRDDGADWLAEMIAHSIITPADLYQKVQSEEQSAFYIVLMLLEKSAGDVRFDDLKSSLTSMLPGDQIVFPNQSVMNLYRLCAMHYIDNPELSQQGQQLFKSYAESSQFNLHLCIEEVNRVLSKTDVNHQKLQDVITTLVDLVIKKKFIFEYANVLGLFDLIPNNLVDSLFPIFSNKIIHACGVPYKFLSLGSVSEYVDDIQYDDDSLLVAIFEKLIKNVKESFLFKFVKSNINSGDPLRTIVFHVINIRYSDISDEFWLLQDYTGIRYAELYDFVKHHAESIQLADVDGSNQFVKAVEKTFPENDEWSKKCRFDLYNLLPDSPSKLELLHENITQSAGITPPEHRGKVAWATFSWRSPGFDDYESFKSSLLSKDDPFVEGKQLVFIEKNPETIIDNMDDLKDIGLKLKQAICSSICKSELSLDNNFKNYLIDTLNESYEDKNTFYSCIFYLKKRLVEDENLKTRIFEIFNSFIDDNQGEYLESEGPGTLVDVLNHWFLSILVIMIENDFKGNSELFMKRIDEMIACDVPASRGAYMLAGFECHLFKESNPQWYSNFISSLVSKDHVAELSQIISYMPHNRDIIELLCHRNLIEDILEQKDENNLWFILGVRVAFLMFDYKNVDVIKQYISLLNDRALEGSLFSLYKSSKFIIENIDNYKEQIDAFITEAFPDFQRRSGVSSNYIIKLSGIFHTDVLHEVLENSIEAESSSNYALIEYMGDSVNLYPEHISRILRTLSIESNYVSAEEVEEVILKLSQYDLQSSIEICNNFINRGMIDFKRVLEKLEL